MGRGRTLARVFHNPASELHLRIIARIVYFGGRCWMCGGHYELMDHVISGGPDVPANMRPACASCNNAKSNRWTHTPTLKLQLKPRAAKFPDLIALTRMLRTYSAPIPKPVKFASTPKDQRTPEQHIAIRLNGWGGTREKAGRPRIDAPRCN